MNEDELRKTLKEIGDLLIEKNKNYGERNIMVLGERGVLVRASDKVARLTQLVWNKEQGTADETVDDTWRDLAGYAIIGLMVHRGVFEK